VACADCRSAPRLPDDAHVAFARAVTPHRLACLLLALPGFAVQAGRPLVTDDAGVIQPAHCELESYLGRLTAGGAATARETSAQLGCGVGAATQLALQALRTGAEAERSRVLAFNAKTRLAVAHPVETAFAVAGGFVERQPPGRGLGFDTAYMTAIATHAWSKVQLHANLGWSRSRATRSSTTSWALAIEWAASERLDLMAETFADDHDRHAWRQAAARWAVLPGRWYLDGSWGTQPGRARAATLGLKLVF
jgi:hypothetical protein